MRRADRLFQIVQKLRDGRTHTARELAEILEVSERTIYRDIQDLSLSGIPIYSQTGIGYSLLPGFELPPLTFSKEELEALLLGARMVQAWTDRDLARAALRAIDRIEAVLPVNLKEELTRNTLLVPDFHSETLTADFLKQVRGAIRNQQILSLDYVRADGEASQRRVHPLGMFYWGKTWTLVAWCELRVTFRQFRLDRIQSIHSTDETYVEEPGRTLHDYLSLLEECKSDQEFPN